MAANDFRDAIRAAGLNPPDVIEPGRWHRFPGYGKAKGNTAGWCRLFADGMGGVFGDYSTELSEQWQARRERPISFVEREAYREQVKRAQAERDAERQRMQADAASKAAERWKQAHPAPDNHPYLARKGIKPNGTLIAGATLLVPMRDASGKLWNLQRIPPDNTEKRFLYGGRVTGCYYGIGKPNGAICIVEGFATGASVHEAIGEAVAVAFTAGNLEAVARELRAKYPDARLVLCADDDYRTPGNPGVTEATKAARAVGGFVAVPDFGMERPDDATDFNDLHQLHGAVAVKRAIANAAPPSASEAANEATNAPRPEEWPAPQPLTTDEGAAPYPLDELPDGIRQAVAEAVDFVQCPPALAACSALSALSLAGQSLADVRRAEGLSGPISLYLLAIADSGERKTTCDRVFLDGIREWEAEREEATRSDVAASRAAIAVWEEKKAGIRARIKQDAAGRKKSGDGDDDDDERLADLERHRPKPFRVPRLIHADATPEALAWGLANGYPFGGVMSSEAGIVFGGHGMGRESVMRNLALLNALWDGISHRVERRAVDGSFTIEGARLTMGLAAQPETVRQFMEATKGLARGNGFAARFLIAAPATTQGTRLFKPSGNRAALFRFGARLRELLGMATVPSDGERLALPMLEFSADAFEAWRAFHDDVERELRAGGEMAEVKDVASKAADNAARMAALFHLYAHGLGGRISADSIASAAKVVSWHLYQARAFLDDVAAPPEIANARRLDAWLLARCRILGVAEIERREVQHSGPNPVRKGPALDAALAVLTEADRVRLFERGKRKLIAVNPALLTGAL